MKKIFPILFVLLLGYNVKSQTCNITATIDTIICKTNPSGNHKYSYSLFINNAMNVVGKIDSITLTNGTITGISTTLVKKGTKAITGTFTTKSAGNNISCFNIKVVFPDGKGTCYLQSCFLLPSCAVNVCDSNLLQNGTFLVSNVPGSMASGGSVSNWGAGYGTPSVFNTEGCDDNGYIKLQGNKVSGDAVKQTLASSNKIVQGNKYILSCCIKLDSAASSLPYLKIRAIAFNGSLPTGNNHPAPDSNIAIIGFTGKINSKDWTSYQFQTWIANKNFDKVAINIFNNDSTLNSAGYIDGICMHATLDSIVCDSIAIDSLGNPVIPPNLAAYLDPNTPLITDSVSMFMGSVHDLYGGFCNTDIDTFYANCPDLFHCATIGGAVPPEALNINFDDSLSNLGINITADSLTNLLKFIGDSIYNAVLDSPLAFLNLGKLDTLCYCDTANNFVADPNSPFGGRDIVFSLGLDPTPIRDKILDTKDPANTRWPKDIKEFYRNYQGNNYYGYWKKRADKYWSDHIQHFLRNKGYKNRLLIVSWASTQTLDYGVHAVLTQISEAMINGTDVELLDPNDPRGTSDFGKDGYVIITHSTGALLVDVAMSLANKTKTVDSLKSKIGSIGYIADKARAHISLHGAFSGSSMATGVVAVFTTPALAGLAALLNTVLHISNSSVYNAAGAAYAVQTSVLRDLVPEVSQLFWMNKFGQFTPVPVLTVAGGHPDNFSLLVKHIFHHGFDDGVLTMDCQCGNFNPSLLWPSGYFPVPYFMPQFPHGNVFDMGISPFRAIGYYIDQKSEEEFPFSVSAACTPYLSPTGMVQPILLNNYFINSMNRYPNHYSFIQSSSDHSYGPLGSSEKFQESGISYYNSPFNYLPTFPNSAANSEEERVVTNKDVYTKGLVSNDMKNIMREGILGKPITVTLRLWPFKKKKTYTYWIWKRTYHRLKDFDTMGEEDYVYKYILK